MWITQDYKRRTKITICYYPTTMELYSIVLVSICISAILAEPIRNPFLKDAENSEGKIVGGQLAARHEFPYQVSLQYIGKHFCGGSILTVNWVVTAAHCMTLPTDQIMVVAGLLNQYEVNTDIQMTLIWNSITHPSYPVNSTAAHPYDIALLMLKSALRWTTAVSPISLPAQNEEFSGYAMLSGWGWTDYWNQTIPTELRKIQLSIWDFEVCSKNLINGWGSIGILDKSMICFGGSGTGLQGSCKGDSGGPAVQNGTLLGISSWTNMPPCGAIYDPSVYTKVSHYVDWIKQYVNVA